MLYQIYRNGKAYGKKSESEVVLDSKMMELKAIHIEDEWEIRRVEDENRI